MKRKSFFKVKPNKTFANAAVKVAAPVTKPWLRFRGFMQRYPRASIAVMLGLVVINMVIMFAYSGDFKAVSYSFSNIKASTKDSSDISDMGIPFSFENYRTMKSIQDTLSWLAAKEHRTTADTTVLLRLIDKIEHLDPSFFDKIKKATYEKDTTGKRK